MWLLKYYILIRLFLFAARVYNEQNNLIQNVDDKYIIQEIGKVILISIRTLRHKGQRGPLSRVAHTRTYLVDSK